MIMPINLFNFIDIIKLLDDNYTLMEKIISQLKFLINELKYTLNELDMQIEKYNYKYIDDTNLEHLYKLFDLQKEQLKNILEYLQTNNNLPNKQLYLLLDKIYTLILQLEDRISVLESYRDIEKLRVNS
jgi:hypothetical protein